MTHLQQIHGEVGGVVDHAVAVFLAEVVRALGEEIECALGFTHLKTGDVLGELHDKVLTALKSLTHLFHTILAACVSGLGGFLAHGARSAGVLALQLIATLHYPLWSGDETDTPTRHGISFRHTVDDHHTVLDVGEGSHGGMRTYIVDMLVNLIGDNDDALVAKQHILQAFQFLKAIDRTCRIGWRTENQGACLGRDGGLQLLGSDLEILLDGSLHNHRLSIGQFHHLGIAHPVGSGNDHLVASIDDGHDGVAHRLFGAIGAEDLRWSVVQTVLVLEFGHDGVLQGWIAWHGRVLGEILVDGLLRCLLDVVGGVEVGFADTEVDDIYTLGLELAAALRHGKSSRG